MKKTILATIVGLILGITGTVIASNYLASEIEYKDTTVEGALNDLYTIHSTYKNLTSETTVTSDALLNGITAYNNLGELVTGTNTDNCIGGVTYITDDIHTSSGQLLFDFIPSKFFIYLKGKDTSNHQFQSFIYYIPEEFGDNIYEIAYGNGVTTYINNDNSVFAKRDGRFYAVNWTSPSGSLNYFACR